MHPSSRHCSPTQECRQDTWQHPSSSRIHSPHRSYPRLPSPDYRPDRWQHHPNSSPRTPSPDGYRRQSPSPDRGNSII